jgi:hypothetical protein
MTPTLERVLDRLSMMRAGNFDAEVPPGTPCLGSYDVADRGTVWADNCQLCTQLTEVAAAVETRFAA